MDSGQAMRDDTSILKNAFASAQPRVSTTFVVPHTWPDIRNAEYEVLERFARAASNIGAVMIAVDNDGYPLWSSDKRPLDKRRPLDLSEVDFMISLHFESPRLLDLHSYYALWQPLDFYDTWGYERVRELVLSHTDALSCSSDLADAHARNLFEGERVAGPGEFPKLFHSPPGPYYPPAVTESSRLFYVGINWERVNSDRGRHQDLLEKLDAEDLIDIYGPRLFLGVEPWRGFKTYRGELPFDGQSVVRAVHRAGVCLALSSEAHQKSALMSNRLFEGLAAGAAVIANSNRFIDRYFSDVVYMIDEDASGEALYFQVKEILERIRANPAEASARAVEGQRRLDEMFSLERCLSAIATGHADRRARFAETFLERTSVAVVFVHRGPGIEEVRERLADIAAQTEVSISLLLVCDERFAAQHRTALDEWTSGRFADFRVVSGPLLGDAADLTGPLIREAIEGIDEKFVAFTQSDERWFRDHLASLAKAIDSTQGATFAASGVLVEMQSYAGGLIRRKRSVEAVGCEMTAADLRSTSSASDPGRFLYQAGLLSDLPSACLDLLDGEEPFLVRALASLKGTLAQSGFATYVRHAERRATLPSPSVSMQVQRRYIGDALRRHPGWKTGAELSEGASARTVGRTTEIGWGAGRALPLALDDAAEVRRGGSGLPYFVSGLSHAEPDFVWVEGHVACFAFDLVNPNRTDIRDLDLELQLAGRKENVGGRPQHCTITVNGSRVGYVELPEVAPATFRFRLPRGAGATGTFRVELAADHAEPVLGTDGQVVDARLLSIQLFSLAMRVAHGDVWPEAVSGRRYELRVGEAGEAFVGAGFFPVETTQVWMGEAPADFRFQLSPGEQMDGLELVAMGLPDDRTAARQEVSVSVNGRQVGKLKLASEAFEPYRLSVPGDVIAPSGRYTVTLSPRHAVSLRGADGRVADNRRLSISFQSLRVGQEGDQDAGVRLERSARRVARGLRRRAGALARRLGLRRPS